jgi:hypothetical protein
MTFRVRVYGLYLLLIFCGVLGIVSGLVNENYTSALWAFNLTLVTIRANSLENELSDSILVNK